MGNPSNSLSVGSLLAMLDICSLKGIWMIALAFGLAHTFKYETFQTDMNQINNYGCWCYFDENTILAGGARTKGSGGIFNNAKEGIAERIKLEEMGHPQDKTTIISDNATAIGITNKTIKHKRSKAMDMRYYWVRDREA